MSTMSLEMRPRSAMLILLALFLFWFITVLLLSLQEYVKETSSLQHEVSLLREVNLHMRTAFNDVNVLADNLARYVAPQNYIQKAEHGSVWSGISWETRQLMLNITGLRELPFENSNGSFPLATPNIYDILPHLKNNSDSILPAFRIARNSKRKATVVLGVSSVKREDVSYLLQSLQSLLTCISLDEEKQTLIVIFIAEINLDFVKKTANNILEAFPRQVNSGIVEIISPRSTYYPDWDTLTPTLGDKKDQFLWRSKAVLDYAYLMMYVNSRGEFYVQLEDDVITKPGFVTEMIMAAREATTRGQHWFLVDFSELGFIGKLFHIKDLPFLVNFYTMFYKNQPVDWMLGKILSTKLCALDKDAGECNNLLKKIWLNHRPSLFQHIGTHSSLSGKTQELKDTKFGQVTSYWPHVNPAAHVSTSLEQHKEYSLDGAYNGKDFFWGISPKTDDHLTFNFDKTVNVTRYLFRSGNLEHLDDKFSNTSVEVLPAKLGDQDIYQHVGWFNDLGIAEGIVNSSFWPLKSIRLRVHQDSTNWLILSEISLVVDPMDEYKG